MKAKTPTAASEDRAYLEAYDVTQFERPSVAVDVVVLGIASDALIALAVEREKPPFARRLALPGGFLKLTESLDAAAARVLREKAGLTGVFLEQLYTFGSVARDPRTRVIAVTYYALVDGTRLVRSATRRGARVLRIREPDAGSFDYLDEGGVPARLAFDHAEIAGTAIRRIRGKLDYAPIGYELLPQTFTLLQLQRVHEIVAGKPMNKDSFRRRMLATGLLEPTETLQSDVGHRPAQLYRAIKPALAVPDPTIH